MEIHSWEYGILGKASVHVALLMLLYSIYEENIFSSTMYSIEKLYENFNPFYSFSMQLLGLPDPDYTSSLFIVN